MPASSITVRQHHGLPWPLPAGATPLPKRHPMVDAVIDEVDGRRIRIGRHWLTDFASCNYLGFDHDEEILDAVDEAVRRWGTHPSWSRLLGSPRLYEQIETELTDLLHAPDTLLMPTITHIHTSVIPLLAGRGTVFLDDRAHKTIYDGCAVARGNGAQLRRFPSGDADRLEEQLREAPSGPRLICLDGVNSMTGNIPDLPTFAQLARTYDALLYVDDAHGFGVIGERSPAESSPYGARGNSVVRYLGENYDNLILVGGFSKAYSSLLAFLTLPTELKNYCKHAAAPYLYSGPSPTASLATVLAGFTVNATRGEAIRADLHRKTRRVLSAVDHLGLDTPNSSGLPIIELPVDRDSDIDDVGRYLYRRGIYVTLATHPLVPRSEVGVRIQLTAANTDNQIDHLIEVLHDLTDRYAMRRRGYRDTPAPVTPQQAGPPDHERPYQRLPAA